MLRNPRCQLNKEVSNILGSFQIQRYQCYEIDDIYHFLAIENILNYKRKYNGK